jgi:hypothetical protein
MSDLFNLSKFLLTLLAFSHNKFKLMEVNSKRDKNEKITQTYIRVKLTAH